MNYAIANKYGRRLREKEIKPNEKLKITLLGRVFHYFVEAQKLHFT